MILSKLIRKREAATATVATFATATTTTIPNVATVATVAVANDQIGLELVATPDDLQTLPNDYSELKTLIGELCRIVGYSEEAQSRMLSTCRNLYPYQVSAERDYFRLQVELAKSGEYLQCKSKRT